jgi:hypothetical protein
LSQPAASPTARTSTDATTLRLMQLFALLTLANLAFQYVTAGRLFPGDADLHAAGAIVLHVVSGLAAVAAIVHRVRTTTSIWPSVIAVVLFVLTFVQAYTGGYDHLAIHVPGAFVLVVGSVWLTVWSLGRAPRL